MIYISTSSIKANKISTAIKTLVNYGFKNIELSGGTKYYDRLEDDLLDLQKKYDLNYLIHNYFPPPKEDFVLNLASLDDEIYTKSAQHIFHAIALCQKLNTKIFGFHAGYYLDFSTKEIGKKIKKRSLFYKNKSADRFYEGVRSIQKSADSITIYIENNVLSEKNLFTFSNMNPFMLTCYNDFIAMKENINFNLLLDIGHLKVSANSLKLNFERELKKLIDLTDYIHISDNNGFEDSNTAIKKSSKLIEELKKYDLSEKIITIEVYDDIKKINESYHTISELY